MTTLTYTPRKTVDYDLGKRCYMPGYVLTDECPKCGAVCTIDFARDYISNPVPGEPEPVDMTCENDHEWEVYLVVRMVLELAPPKKKRASKAASE